jgi:hypothetical protein
MERVVADTDSRIGQAFSSSSRRMSVDFPLALGPDTMMRGAIGIFQILDFRF